MRKTTPKKPRYVLRLYVAGTTEASVRAIANIKAVCDEHLAGIYSLEVVDIYQQPKLARDEQIVAVPTLIKALPRPVRLLVGGMSNLERVLIGLDIVKKR